jgi:5'-3' exonuclease
MGVPSFFKWLAKRYPKTVQNAAERRADEPEPVAKQNDADANGSAGSSSSSANGVEDRSGVWQPVGDNPRIDNLYLDMNGIIHPVSAHALDDVLRTQTRLPTSI